MTAFQRVAAVVNTVVRPLVGLPALNGLVGGWMALLSYTGRKSGRTFTIPVGYTRRGEDVTIPVEFPDSKTWWRNFTGEGGPLGLRLQGVDRTGHAVATRDGAQVTVAVRLDPA